VQSSWKDGHLAVTPVQLVAILQQMTALQELDIQGFRSMAHMIGHVRLTRSAAAALSAAASQGSSGAANSSVKVCHDVRSVELLLQGMVGLQGLVRASVSLPVCFSSADMRVFKIGMERWLPSSLNACCDVYTWCVALNI
jgi:hypothetical protein